MKTQQEFKNTEIGKIPKEWEVVRLGEVTEIYDSKRVPLSEMERANKKGTYPYCGANGIIDYVNEYIFDGRFILLAEDGGSYGRFQNSCYIMDGKFWVNNHAHILRAHNDKSINMFLMYMLNFLDLRPYIVGSTRVKLNQAEMREIKLPLPPLPEQKKIAEILMTADEAIEKVNEAIEKTERLKKGLMQELLTGKRRVKESKGQRVIESKGKDTEIGRIPKGWEVVSLSEIVDINRKTVDPTKFFPEKRFLYIDIDSVENGTGIIKGSKEILGKDAPSRARRVMHHNDILMSTVRPYLKAFTIVPKKLDNQICSTGFAVLTCKEKVLPLYLLFTIFSKTIIDQCNRMMVGGQYPALSSSQVEKLKLPLPPLPEQQKISEILSTVDNKLELLREKKERFERVKRGLMEELLTGRKRVSP